MAAAFQPTSCILLDATNHNWEPEIVSAFSRDRIAPDLLRVIRSNSINCLFLPESPTFILDENTHALYLKKSLSCNPALN